MISANEAWTISSNVNNCYYEIDNYFNELINKRCYNGQFCLSIGFDALPEYVFKNISYAKKILEKEGYIVKVNFSWKVLEIYWNKE